MSDRAYTSFEQLHPGLPIARAEGVGIISPHRPGPVPPDVETMYPVGVTPPPKPPRSPWEAPPAPPPLSEVERRERLEQAKQAQRNADAALRDAQGAHGRAERLLRERQMALAEFAELDDARLRETIEALRGRGAADLSDEQRERLAKREVIRGEVAIAAKAAETLGTELRLMQGAAEKATRAVELAVTKVLEIERERIERHRETLLAEAEAAAYAVRSFGNTPGWQAARQALLADSDAALSVPVEPEPRPAPPMLDPRKAPVGIYGPAIEVMVPVSAQRLAELAQIEAAERG